MAIMQAEGAPDATASPASSGPKGAMREVEHWHIKADGRIYQTDGEHSSVIAEIDGRIVTTQSGSKYKLGTMDPHIQRIVAITGAEFDPDNPLENLPALLYAEKLVYGDAGRTATRIGDLLRRLEAQLDVPELTAHHFSVVRHVFQQLGIVMEEDEDGAEPGPASGKERRTSGTAYARESKHADAAPGAPQ